MSFRCLSDFLEELGHAGELARVGAEVDPPWKSPKSPAGYTAPRALPCSSMSVRGHEIPVLTNVLGTQGRICRALGVSRSGRNRPAPGRTGQPAGAEGWLHRLRASSPGSDLGQNAAAAGEIGGLPADRPPGQRRRSERIAHAPAPRRTTPAARCTRPWSIRPSPIRTAKCLAATTSFRWPRIAWLSAWAEHDEPARLLAEYRRRGEAMPLAVVVGGDPATLLAAVAGWSPELDTFALAGLFRDKPLDVVACRSVDLIAPAEAEIVLEGHVDPTAPLVEAGPLPTPLGYYGRPRPAAVMRVTAVTQRANPIAWAMLPAR